MRQCQLLPRRLGLVVLLAALVIAGPHAAGSSVTALLDRYSAGHFVEVIGTIEEDNNYDDLLKNLKKDAPGWIEAAGPGDRARRQLAAATLALAVAARAGDFQFLIGSPWEARGNPWDELLLHSDN